MSDEAPPETFRNYLAPLTIGGLPTGAAAKWQAALSWISELSAGNVEPLTAVAFDEKAVADPSLASLWEAVSAADEDFSVAAAPRTARLIAAGILDHLFTENAKWDTLAALSVSTAAFGRKVDNLPVDIVKRAISELDSIADTFRDRGKPINPTESIAIPSIAAPKTLQTIKSGEVDGLTIAATFEDILKHQRALATTLLSARQAVSSLQRQAAQRDEELEVLWFTFGGQSEDAGKPFDEVGSDALIFYAARELASRTTQPLRHDALLALFVRLGVKEDVLTLADAVATLPTAWIAAHVPRESSALILPIHRALDRARDHAMSESWKAGWEEATGIDAELSLTGLDLSVAFYRECMLAKALG